MLAEHHRGMLCNQCLVGSGMGGSSNFAPKQLQYLLDLLTWGMALRLKRGCSTISELADIRKEEVLDFKPTNLSKLADAALTTNMHSDVPVDYMVSCGGTHSVALTRDGRMFSFGRGDHGLLGYGRKVTTGQPSEVPIILPAPKNLSGG